MFIVLGERYVIPSETHLDLVSEDSTISHYSDAFPCLLEGELIEKLVILSIPEDFHLCD